MEAMKTHYPCDKNFSTALSKPYKHIIRFIRDVKSANHVLTQRKCIIRLIRNMIGCIQALKMCYPFYPSSENDIFVLS